MTAAAVSPAHSNRQNRSMRYLYLLTVFFMSLTGFGQMPIYKRYYLSDIPGFGWLANFWTTRYVHYVGAALLLAGVSMTVYAFQAPSLGRGILKLLFGGLTVIVGVAFSWMTGMPLIIALVFGALISPTDPVAVLGVLGLWVMLRRQAGPSWARSTTPHWVEDDGKMRLLGRGKKKKDDR